MVCVTDFTPRMWAMITGQASARKERS
jgi:hypothetical protein